MLKFLESIKELHKAECEGLLERHVGSVEYHIFLDDAVNGNYPNEFFLQLLSLVESTFSKLFLFGQSDLMYLENSKPILKT